MTTNIISDISSTKLSKSLLRTLIYFDVFKHPLSSQELQAFCDYPQAQPEQIAHTLQQLQADELIFQHQGFYSISKQAVRATRRIAANKRAEPYLAIAHRLSRFLGAFPFVRAVMISGSLSKRCVYKDSDIDYMIVTTANRTWFVRGALRFLVKLLLFHRFKKFFCLNYFIDEAHLDLDMKNHYIASEMAFLIPTYGQEVYHQLWEENPWVRKYYPNFPKADTQHISYSKPSSLKALTEKLLSNRFVDYLNERYQNYSARNWQKKVSKQKISNSALLEGETGEIKSFSFSPEAFMNVFTQRVQQFEAKHQMDLEHVNI